ncbi:expansin family protein [Crucibulum laeve]|uniref:Expansin family protein n=1 Tax=Crucibulum laeve TaxID=68775 RepID=A0A5C3M1G0_9AGAR|nr:expansin family protein [Crucibulum laeve]
MYRTALFLFAFFASLLAVIASPVPVANGELIDVEKRLTRDGRATWFNVGLGNCGKWNVDTDLIVAIGKGLYDRNGGSNCDQYVEIVNTKNGKKAYGKTRDSCPSCSDNDLDLSPSLFQKLGTLDQGVLSISWHFMNKGFKP